MALQLILGGSGYGKSQFMYEQVIRASIENPDLNYIIIVPEQYTMQVQKKIVSMHPKGGMLNVDVVSFGRLAYRVFDALNMPKMLILEDIGKSMVLRKVMSAMASELTVLKGNVRKQGFVGEMKSAVSELLQYHVTPGQLLELSEELSSQPMLSGKLHDIGCIFEAFQKEIEDRYMTAEELLDRFTAVVPDSEFLKNSYIYLDEFTGFTPSQYKLLGALLKQVRDVQISITVDVRDNFYETGAPFKLFYLTRETIHRLERLCMTEHIERSEDIVLKDGVRFKNSRALAFMERHIYRNQKGSVYDAPTDDIHLLPAMNPAAELRAMTHRMKKLLRDGVRFREMAVITGDLSVYGHMIEREMAQAEIPYFIDSRKSVLENCLVEFVRALLEVVSDDFKYESVFRYLKTAMTDILDLDIDRLENYILATGIRGAKQWMKPFERRYKGMSEGEIELINETRHQVMEWLLPVKSAIDSSDGTAGSYAGILMDFLKTHDFEKRIDAMCERFEADGALALAKEYSQIYGAVTDILEKLMSVFGSEPMSLKEFSDILDAGFGEAKVGIIPPGLDQVIVGDLRRTRLDGIRVMFFVGVNDGIVPSALKEGGLINDMDKELLAQKSVELSPTAKQDACTDRFYIYTVLTKASQALYVSFSNVDAHGKPMRPSSLISKLTAMFPSLGLSPDDAGKEDSLELYDRREMIMALTDGFGSCRQGHADRLWLQLYLWLRSRDARYVQRLCGAAFLSHEDDRLSDRAVRALYGHTLENSVTTLEKYASCAYAHFLMYGLKLKERAEYRIEAPDLGILFHSALELFSKRLAGSEYTWHTAPDDFRERLAGECVEAVAANSRNAILLDNYRNKFLIYRLVRMVRRTVWALQKQLQKGSFEPKDYELRFDRDGSGTVDIALSDDEVLHLKGTIDRLDTCEDDENIYVKVVDYKSGSKKFDLVALYYGLQLQLVVYMDAAMDMKRQESKKQIIPAGILYYHIDDPLVSAVSTQEAEDVTEALLKALKMNGLVNENMSIIRMMDGSFDKESDVIPVALNKDGTLSKKSATASTEKFGRLFDFTAQTVRRIGRDILDGRIDVRPYKRGSKGNACTYCAYKPVCGFDETVDGYSFRQLAELSAQAVWHEICGKEQ